MSNNSGTISYLRKMAERCRRAAEESRSDEEAQYLVEIAQSCEERLAERQRAEMILASEEH
jgi:aspartate/glutamate racemase